MACTGHFSLSYFKTGIQNGSVQLMGPTRRRKDNIKMNLKKKEVGGRMDELV